MSDPYEIIPASDDLLQEVASFCGINSVDREGDACIARTSALLSILARIDAEQARADAAEKDASRWRNLMWTSQANSIGPTFVCELQRGDNWGNPGQVVDEIIAKAKP